MVGDRLDDGVRIAQLLASELVAAGLSVTDADPGIDPTADGARAFAVADGDGLLATVFVHPDHARADFERGQESVVEAARETGLRVRPAAADSQRIRVVVPDGATVKRARDVFEAVARGE
jgi:hypothetical protein